MSYKSVISVEGLLSVATKNDLLLAESWEERLELIKHKVKFVKNRPGIVCLESIDPLIVSGKWVPSLIFNAGGNALLIEEGQESSHITLTQILETDPDGIIISLKGKTLPETKTLVANYLSTGIWDQLKAVQKGHIFIADGLNYFNTAGPEIIDTAEIIAEILQVNQFYYGMEGEIWEQLTLKP